MKRPNIASSNFKRTKCIHHIQGVSKKRGPFFENTITPSFIKETFPNFLWL